MKVIHLRQLHASQDPVQKDTPQAVEWILESQIQIATFLVPRPDIPVFLESCPEYGNKTFMDKIVKDLFPRGLDVSDLNEAQKKCLYKYGAADILYHLGFLKDAHSTTTLKYGLEVDARIRAGDKSYIKLPREAKAMSLISNLVLQRPEVKEVILVFGRGHNFTKICQQYGFEYEGIDTVSVLPSKPGERKYYPVFGHIYLEILFCEDIPKLGCYWLRMVDTSKDDLIDDKKFQANYYIMGTDKVTDLIQYLEEEDNLKLVKYVKGLNRYSADDIAKAADEQDKLKKLSGMQKIVKRLLRAQKWCPIGNPTDEKFQDILNCYSKRITKWQEEVATLSKQDIEDLRNDIFKLEAAPAWGFQNLTGASYSSSMSSRFFNSAGTMRDTARITSCNMGFLR